MSVRSPSFNTHWLTVAFTAAAADTSFTHDLGRTPQAAFVIFPDTTAAVIYKGSVAWTSTTINLRSSVANVGVTVMLV